MRIVKMTAQNIKKLKVVEITPDGNLVQITGANGAGKSSVLDAIYYALAGTAHLPSVPVRQGEEKAHVRLELGELTVTRRFTKEGGTSLIVEAQNGARFPSPQKVLDDLLGQLTFDPLEFSRMKPKAQLDALRSVVPLSLNLEELDALNQRDFDARTALNREVKSLDNQAAAIVVPEGTPEEGVDDAAIVKELEAAGEHNTAVEKHKADLGRIRLAIDQAKQEAYSQRRIAEDYRKKAEAADQKAEELSAASLQNQSNLEHLEAQNKLTIDTTEIKTKFNQAKVTNAAVQNKQRQKAIWAEAKKKRETADALTNTMAERLRKKEEAISTAQMPVPGLTFGDGEVLLNGLPLAQASSAEQLRVLVAIAMAANPKLRVLRITDGSLLDESNFKLIAEMADQEQYQVWIETVSGKCGIVMEDGEVKDLSREKEKASA
jgi:energy-coupling factor transporter ATP-binding protein EcfA2